MLPQPSPRSATLDSGASHTMCGDASLFANLRRCKHSPLRNRRTVTIKNALLIKGLSTMLISSGQLWDLHGVATHFAEHATLTRNGTVIATGSRTKGSLYLLNGVVARPRTMQDPIDFLSDPFAAQAVALTAAIEDDMGAHNEAFSLPSRDPRNHRKALTDVDSAGWLDGEKGDYKVFHPVDRSSVPPTAKIFGRCFHYRRKGYGKTRALKVRLVAQGCNQHPGLDFRETFAPVTKFTSIRVLLALAAQQRMHSQQADVDKAYLHADLNEELYMRVPDGVDSPDWDGKVLKYGRTISNICVYIRREGGNYHYIALYVDDLLFLSHSQSEIGRVKGWLREQYGIKDLGDASCIHGIDLVRRLDGSVFLSQRAYLETVLAHLGQLECHTAPTPMIPNQQLIPAPADSANDPSLRHRYLQAVGSLMYAMLGIRPDLAHSYIKASLNISLLYLPSNSPIGSFNTYSDNWGVRQVQIGGLLGINAWKVTTGALLHPEDDARAVMRASWDRLNEFTVSFIIISCQHGIVHRNQHCSHDMSSYWAAFPKVGKYSSRAFRAYLDKPATAFESPLPYSPILNGVTKWLNHSILKRIRTMMHQAGADKSLWAEALLAFIFIKNQSPHAALNSKVPLLVWEDRPVRVDMLRVWGSRAWHTLANLKSKLDDRAIPLIFVSYEGDT
ncbi:hypothetical protein JCM21900_003041 [Sporobolomyces salmonicolor]